LLEDLAEEVSIQYKWMKVGLTLGLSCGNLEKIEEDIKFSKRPLKMLLEWEKAAGDNFTYEKLASALEKESLNHSARKYCYES